MKRPDFSRRSFIRTLLGLFAFIPAARSLTVVAASEEDIRLRQSLPPLAELPPPPIPADELEMLMKTRIAKGKVLALEGPSVWINDRLGDKLRLVLTDDSIVWKGKYNKGNNFDSYPHMIEPDDAVIALGQRNGSEFVVEKMYANILNTRIMVEGLSFDQDGATISYADASNKRGVVKVRPDYLIGRNVYKDIVDKGQQLVGRPVQIIGLPLKDGTILAANVLF